MKITFKLFASLTEYLPAEARRGNRIELEIDPDATIAKILTANGIDPAAAKSAGEADKVTEHLTAMHNLGLAIGIQGTPAFIVGDQLIPGADMEALKRAIEIARAKQIKPAA